MVALEILDDDARFGHGTRPVHQERHLASRPQRQVRGPLAGVAQVEQALVHLDAEHVDGDQYLVAAGRQWMVVERERIHAIACAFQKWKVCARCRAESKIC